MGDVISLAVPFFGVIFLGYGCGKFVRIPESGLAWLSFFIIYIALPALFFSLVSRTPFHELANGRFVLTTLAATFTCFVLSFSLGLWMLRGRIPEATIAAALGAYANIGYMGPGLTLAALGPQATVPTALIFVFDSLLLFTSVPLLMAVGGASNRPLGETIVFVVKRVLTHPFNVATMLGFAAAYMEFQAPAALDRTLEFLKNAAAPCALFTLGVTVALRPPERFQWEVPPLLVIKLLVHPLLAWTFLSLVGGFDPVWVYTAVLMTSLPPALNAFVLAKQYNTYVEGASGGVLIGTVASVFTVTTLLYLIQQHLLPVNLFH